jgi:hypothetical protein
MTSAILIVVNEVYSSAAVGSEDGGQVASIV